MIKDATFISVWDGGFELISDCKVNTETREIFDITTYEDAVDDDGYELEVLDREYVIVDGEEFCAGNVEQETENWNPDTDYWYR